MPIFIWRVRAAIALGGEMDFGQPHDVEAPALGGVDLRHRLVEHFGLAAPRHRRKLVEHAEFHRRPLPIPYSSLSLRAERSNVLPIWLRRAEIASSLRSSQ
jgi:hypothetical protein